MKKYVLAVVCFMSICATMQSQEFVYRAKNPAFGGESFNYQWLLSSAEAQNTIEEDVDPRNRDTDLEDFKDNLNRQFLNRLNRVLLNSQLAVNDGLAPGTYSFGSLSVEVYESSEGLVVNILDTDTGEQTQVIIP